MLKQFGGAFGAAAGAKQRKIFRNLGDAEPGIGGEVALHYRTIFKPRQKSGRVLLLEVAVQHGAAKVAVDDQRPFAVAGETARNVAGDEGLTLAGNGARDEDGLWEIQLRMNLDRAVDAEKCLDAR